MARGLPGDLVVLQVAPQLELVLPLVHRDAVGDQAQHALLDARRRGDAHQRLAGATGQHNDACTQETFRGYADGDQAQHVSLDAQRRCDNHQQFGPQRSTRMPATRSEW